MRGRLILIVRRRPSLKFLCWWRTNQWCQILIFLISWPGIGVTFLILVVMLSENRARASILTLIRGYFSEAWQKVSEIRRQRWRKRVMLRVRWRPSGPSPVPRFLNFMILIAVTLIGPFKSGQSCLYLLNFRLGLSNSLTLGRSKRVFLFLLRKLAGKKRRFQIKGPFRLNKIVLRITVRSLRHRLISVPGQRVDDHFGVGLVFLTFRCGGPRRSRLMNRRVITRLTVLSPTIIRVRLRNPVMIFILLILIKLSIMVKNFWLTLKI